MNLNFLAHFSTSTVTFLPPVQGQALNTLIALSLTLSIFLSLLATSFQTLNKLTLFK